LLHFFLQHSKNTVNNFLQLIFEDIVGEILVHQTTIAKDNADKEQSMISDNDQSILYYIAGYILRSLHKKYLRYSKHKLSLVDKFSDNSENHNFVQKYDRWYKIQDRGGLQKPCDTFFLLVRELELVVRKSVTAKLSANSLLLGPLKENIMESFMVKYYCDILIPNESCEVVSSVTEDIVHLFLTIRGYAVTRLERNKLQKSANGKASLSLRQVLKEKVHN